MLPDIHNVAAVAHLNFEDIEVVLEEISSDLLKDEAAGERVAGGGRDGAVAADNRLRGH